MTPEAKARLSAWFRPRWAWFCLALGLPGWVLPESVTDPAGCLFFLLDTAALVGFVALLYLGLRWLWRKLLFRVSRRLWVMLLLLSCLPAVLLTGLFLSLGWLALGGQVSRTLQANVRVAEAAMRRAAQEPSDAAATAAMQWLGNVVIVRVDKLPEGVAPDFVGLVWNEDSPLKGKGILLRAVSREGNHYRLLNLSLGTLAEQSKGLWGGRIHYRLDEVEKETARVKVGGRRSRRESQMLSIPKDTPPLEAWSQGDPLKGTGLLHPFRLPAVGLAIGDWRMAGRRDLLLTATPETSLRELWRGYGYAENRGNRSSETLKVQLIIGLLLFLGFCGQLVAMVMGLYLARQLGKAVDDLFDGVRRLAAGDFAARIRPRTQDQVGRLAQAFNSMAMAMEQSLAERQKRLALEEELRVAREVQMHLLPDIPLLPHQAVVHATLMPARDVAGDYYDLFRLQDGRLAFLIADVSGKGTSAAFYAAETKGVVAALDKMKRGPREVAERLNEIWCEGHSKRVFMTLVYGVFDPKDGAFAFVRAGHPAPLVRRRDGRVEALNPRGLGIGLTRDRFLEHLDLCEGRLGEGEALLCYTDGLSEAARSDGELFGEARIAAALAASGIDLQAHLLAAASGFTGGAPLEDDLTLLILQRG